MQERPVFLTVSTILRLDEANQNKFNTTNSINCQETEKKTCFYLPSVPTVINELCA